MTPSKARKSLRVEVTAEHIAAGAASNAFHCPVALACEAAGLRLARVDGVNVGFDGGPEKRGSARLPVRASRFVDDFDNERPVKPFSFVLRLP